MSLSWDKASSILEWDGSLFHICVLDTDVDDWDAVIHELRNDNKEFTFSADGKLTELGGVTDVFAFRRTHLVSLSVKFGRLVLNSYFYEPSEIIFDCDPRDLKDQLSLDSVADFMTLLSKVTKKDVILTPYGEHDYPLISYIWSDNRFVYNHKRPRGEWQTVCIVPKN
jgi:hypothetical protein